jgi:Tfp pilus assembly protein PilZ
MKDKRATSCAYNYFLNEKIIFLKTTFIDLGETILLYMILRTLLKISIISSTIRPKVSNINDVRIEILPTIN